MNSGLSRLSSRFVIWNSASGSAQINDESLQHALRDANTDAVHALHGLTLENASSTVRDLCDNVARLELGIALSGEWPPEGNPEIAAAQIAKQPIEILNLSVRSMNCLSYAGIVTVEELASLSTSELLNIPNMGRTSIAEISEKLEAHNIQFDLRTPPVETWVLDSACDLESLPLTSMDLSVRSFNCLNNAGIRTIGDLVRRKESELLSLRNMGRKSLNEIRGQLETLKSSLERLPRNEMASRSLEIPRCTLFPLATLLKIEECGLPEHISGPLIAERIETVYSLVKCSFPKLRDLFDGNPANARALQLWLHSLGLRLGTSLAECLDSHFNEVADAFAEDTNNLALHVTDDSNDKEAAGSSDPRIGQPTTCLEDELEKVLAATRSEKNKRVVRLFLGWDGGASTTLEKAGQAFQITRERVRQIIIRVLTNARPFSTVFAEKAIAFVASLAPVLAEDAENALRSAGIVKSKFRLESLAATAKAFNLYVPWRVQSMDGARTVTGADDEVKSSFHGFLSEAHRRISHYGTTTKSKVRAVCSFDTSTEALDAFCDRLENLYWLDDEKEWFWMPTTRNALLSRLTKVLRVVPALTIEQAHEAVLRDRRMNEVLLPIPVFRQLCDIQTWCRINDGKVEATEDLPEAEEYESAELILVDLLRRHGRVMRTQELHVLAEERGVGEGNFGRLLCGSNLLVQHGRGVVGLVGSDMEQLRQKELVLALDVVDAAESQNTSEDLGESYESLLDGCEPTSSSFHRQVARAVMRASTRLRKGGAWSLAELAFSPKDLGTLETWSNSGLPPPSQRATTGFMSSEMGVDEQESIALLFLLFCFQVTRNHGTEGEIWPLVERTLNPTLRTYFFHVRSVPKVRIREATERVCVKLRIRNLFGREGEYSWLRTVFLQFGITRRGLQRLPAWLGQLAPLPVAVEDLLNSETLRSESFGDFWRTLQLYRAGQLSRATAARVLGVNPWVDQRDVDLILEATVERDRQHHHDGEAKRIGLEDSEQLFGPPTFCWDGPAPEFQMALSSRSRWLTEARYAITLSPSKQRLSVVRTDQEYRIDSQYGLLHVDLSTSTVEVDLLFRQKSSLAEPIQVCLLPQGCEYIFYELRTGRALPIGEGSVRPNHPYALLARDQLDVTHESPELQRVFGGEWVARAYRSGLPADLLIMRGEVIVWEQFQVETTSKEDPIPSIEATCSGGRWGEKSLLTVRLKTAEITPEFLIFGEQRLELKQSNNDTYSCWLTLMPNVEYEKTRGRVECRYRNRLRWLTVKVSFGPIEGTAIETEGGWKTLRAYENLDSEYLRQHRIYTKIPGVFDGDRVEPAEWVWLEGAHFCGRPRNTPSLFGETAYAVGESLWLSVGPYNRPRLGEKLASSIINSGVVKTVEFRAGMWELQFRQSIELDPDYQLWIWENDVPQPRPLSKSEWLYDDGLCVIESQGEFTSLSFAVSYQGHWLGAKSTCPGWKDYEKLISESVDWPSTARWLKWWRVPVLNEDLKAPISRAVTKAPLQSLQSWLLRGQLTEIARFSEEFEDAWLSVCRQVLWEWRPCRNEAAQLLRGLGADVGAADVQWDGNWDDLGQLLNINPLLFVRLCSEGLAVLCPDANAEDRLRMRRQLRNRILGLRLYCSEPEVSEALMNAHSEAAKAMAVDDRFVSRSLLVDAISLYSGKLHQHHNLRIAISNSQAVRTYLAATILQKVIDGEI